MENLRLLEADLEAEDLSSVCDASRGALQGYFCVGHRSSIVCEEEVPDQSFLSLGVDLEAP
mgnify:CR=1 FL=1